VTRLDPFAEMEGWAAALPAGDERVPTVCHLAPDTYAAIVLRYPQPVAWEAASRFPGVRVVLSSGLDAAWVMYDQRGDEMGRSAK
jgi:hypothetical protein